MRQTYKYNDLRLKVLGNSKTIAPNTIVYRDPDSWSPEGGHSEFITVILHGNPIYTVEDYRGYEGELGHCEGQILLRLLPDSFTWFTFTTCDRINLVCNSYGYTCRRVTKGHYYQFTTPLDPNGLTHCKDIYPDSYPLILNPHYLSDFTLPVSRGYPSDREGDW